MFKRGNDTARRGLVTHLAVAMRLVERGYEVLQPFGDYLRYDLGCYIPASSDPDSSEKQEAHFVRIQCKSARLSEDRAYLAFNAYNISGGRGARRSYQGDAEYFGVYSCDTGKVYLIPVYLVPYAAEARLRLKETKNNQDKRINWAKDYEL
jgi:hypothetical protein